MLQRVGLFELLKYTNNYLSTKSEEEDLLRYRRCLANNIGYLIDIDISNPKSVLLAISTLLDGEV